jgi:hypothetical protein
MPKFMSARRLNAYRDQSWTYRTFASDGRLHIVCPQCRALILLFEDLEPDVRREIAELKSQSAIEAIRLLRNRTKCNLTQAKANLLHMRTADSCCHSCKAAVLRGALLCPQCMSVNLDWMP